MTPARARSDAHMTGPNPLEHSPLFTALGYVPQCNAPSHYVFRIGPRVRRFRAWEMKSVTFLLELHADVDHWRDVFPGIKRTGIDAIKAAAHFMRLCHEAGEYVPESVDPPAVRTSEPGVAGQ